jgi:hypothetical protein
MDGLFLGAAWYTKELAMAGTSETLIIIRRDLII